MKFKFIKPTLAAIVIAASSHAFSAEAPVMQTPDATAQILSDAFAAQSAPAFTALNDNQMKQVSAAGCFPRCFATFWAVLMFTGNWSAGWNASYGAGSGSSSGGGSGSSSGGGTNNQPYNPSCVNGTSTRRVC